MVDEMSRQTFCEIHTFSDNTGESHELEEESHELKEESHGLKEESHELSRQTPEPDADAGSFSCHVPRTHSRNRPTGWRSQRS